jgi:histidine triad (HIT) family protein
MEDCIFCKIASGEVPVSFVYEDADVVAFNDVNPQAPVHVLIIPRSHHTCPGDGISVDLAAALWAAIPKVAALTRIADTGYRAIINCGPDSRQLVPHLHIHILGGAQMSHGLVELA